MITNIILIINCRAHFPLGGGRCACCRYQNTQWTYPIFADGCGGHVVFTSTLTVRRSPLNVNTFSPEQTPFFHPFPPSPVALPTVPQALSANSHFEDRIPSNERQLHVDLDVRVVLPVFGVVAFQQIAPRLPARAGVVCQVQIHKAQLLVGTPAFHLLHTDAHTRTHTDRYTAARTSWEGKHEPSWSKLYIIYIFSSYLLLKIMRKMRQIKRAEQVCDVLLISS